MKSREEPFLLFVDCNDLFFQGEFSIAREKTAGFPTDFLKILDYPIQVQFLFV
jgi:hypothetical protein